MTPKVKLKLPATLVSFTEDSNRLNAGGTWVYRDANGRLWKTDNMPAFWFDMEYVGDGKEGP